MTRGGELIGRDAILESLYRLEYGPMVRLAFALVGNAEEAEDLVHDSFVEVSRRLDQIRSPGGYLRSAVVSRSRSSLRRRHIAARKRPEPPVELTAEASELWDVLEALTEDQRIAVVLRYWAGYRLSEIAEVVQMPASTVRSHLRRGLRVLRKELEE